jgi:hypothetical protein
MSIISSIMVIVDFKIGWCLTILLLLLSLEGASQVDFPPYRPQLYADSTYYKFWKADFEEISRVEEMSASDYWNQFIDVYKAKPVKPQLVIYFFRRGVDHDADAFCDTYFQIGRDLTVLEDQYYRNENILMRRYCTATFALYDHELIGRLNDIDSTDQLFRSERSYDESQQKALDSLNTLEVADIIQTYGYPNRSMVGVRYEGVVARVILHSDLGQMEEYLPLVARQCFEEDLPKTYYACLIDRIAILKGEHQVYGTQFYSLDKDTSTPYRLDDLEKVNQSRVKLGLEPLR